MAQIPDGYELLVGRSRENARKALAMADERGLPPQAVLTRRSGYLIPIIDEVVADDPDGDIVELVGEPIDSPDESWKNEDIDAWAQTNLGIDVTGQKKADKLQAILEAIPELSNEED